MTEEILEPGRELDQLVARKVMGLALHKWRFERAGSGRNFICEACDACFCSPPWSREKLPAFCGGEAPLYSTSMAAAWTVVEKVGLGIRPVLVPGKPWKSVTSDGATWSFHPASEWEVTHPVDHHIILARHKSPAAAVCIGALRALELLKGSP